jgi:outer membrane protein TolC
MLVKTSVATLLTVSTSSFTIGLSASVDFFQGETMKSVSCRALNVAVLFVATAIPFLLCGSSRLSAEPLPLKRAVELALSHGTATAIAGAEEQHALASYHELRDSYLPQLVLGSGLGASWGYPLTLEGSAPSIINVTSQAAVVNAALRDFVRAAKADLQATTMQSKDQRAQVIQDTVLSYAELNQWEALLSHLREDHSDALKMEGSVRQRIQEGVDNALAQDQARLTTARVYLRIIQAQAAIAGFRSRLAHLTGLSASAIEIVPESIPALPEIKQPEVDQPRDSQAENARTQAKQDYDLASLVLKTSPVVLAAETRATAQSLRARGEHRAMWPTLDFAAQYALLSTFNNYQDFFRPGSFQRHNATVGVAIRFPFLSPSQHARAQAADADAVRATKQAQAVKNQVSEETLKLQGSVAQLAAAQQVADLEYKIAQSNLQAVRIRVDSGTATLHDSEDARIQANERFNALQDADLELERGRIGLLRATGELESWVGVGK